MKKVCILTGALLCLALPTKSEDTPKASQGYRGFIDFGYNIGTMTYDDANRIELSCRTAINSSSRSSSVWASDTMDIPMTTFLRR